MAAQPYLAFIGPDLPGETPLRRYPSRLWAKQHIVHGAWALVGTHPHARSIVRAHLKQFLTIVNGEDNENPYTDYFVVDGQQYLIQFGPEPVSHARQEGAS